MPKKLQISYISPSLLKNYGKNSRVHSSEQINRIEKSIKQFGFINPVIIDNNKTIIAGHARVTAAKNLKLKEIPTLCAEHLTQQQIQAYVIADNRLSELSSWDDAILHEELNTLLNSGFDTSLFGFENKLPNAEEILQKDTMAEYKNILAVHVECISEREQQEVFNLLTEKGYKCKILSI